MLLLTESLDTFVDASSCFSHEFMLQEDPRSARLRCVPVLDVPRRTVKRLPGETCRGP